TPATERAMAPTADAGDVGVRRVTTSPLVDVARMFRRRHAARCGLGLVVALTVCAVLAPLLTPHDPNEVDTTRRLARPLSPGHPLGTDEFGRDMTARLLHGARISLTVGLAATALAALAGSLCGLLAGLGGGGGAP